MSTSPRSLSAYLTPTNADYIADLYRRFLQSPASVDAGWQNFFRDLNDQDAALLRELDGASWTPDRNRRGKGDYGIETGPQAAKTAKGQAQKIANDGTSDSKTNAGRDAASAPSAALVRDGMKLRSLIAAYRTKGHRLGHYDPLGLTPPAGDAELDPSAHGFSADDYERTFDMNGELGLTTPTLRNIVSTLRHIYGGTIGVEMEYLDNPVEREWLRRRIEAPRLTLSPDARRAILQRLVQAEGFEQFLHTKFQGAKRFGADGIESMIPALDAVMAECTRNGAREFVFGMAHRGRLNVLTNICGKPYVKVLAEFQGIATSPADLPGSGDVKYHMGYSMDRAIEGHDVHITLTPNPSHLEQVNPVVAGRARAKQKRRGDTARRQVVPIVIHGDAAVAGQGIVAETLQMAELAAYNVGGTIHIIANNQVGFTTNPSDARSGPYASDICKMINIPILHVNADDVEAVVQVSLWAAEYRQTFGRDVVIDLIGYRRYGHNEGDEPAFTQPVMYQTIAAHPPVRKLYADQLVRDNLLSVSDADALVANFQQQLNADFETSKGYKPNKADWFEGPWRGFDNGQGSAWNVVTGVDMDRLRAVGRASIETPADFALNSKIARQFESKKTMFDTGEGIDWATAEALAFGTLLEDGYDVRLTGEDVGRGTFSHRHATLRDQATDTRIIPLARLTDTPEGLEIYESHLSEAATVGYEYGYAFSDPKTLTVWEGQFGDFINGAQILIDQFIASGETKWLRTAGLVMLLPHGMEGQGPEHSSARLERFLQLCAEDNMQVVNMTTPANYFHALRRQMVRSFRKPLIVMSPKSLLRHKMAVSTLGDMGAGTQFHPVIGDAAVPARAKRVILCSGKVYYDLVQERDKRALKHIAIVRLEQFYPFPSLELATALKDHAGAEIIWCQEEPENQGGWTFVDRRIEKVLIDLKAKNTRPRYVGRAAAAAPACGYLNRHNKEQAALIDAALG